MDKFKDACKQSCEDWANSFDDAQDYEFSSAFESKMEKLPDELETKKHRKPSKKTIALLVNAAVILCFCTAVLIIPAAREQVVGIFKGYVSDSGISSGEDTTIWSPNTELGLEIDDGDTEMTGRPDITVGSNPAGNADDTTSSSENTDNPDSEENTGTTGSGLMMGGEGDSYKECEVKLGYIPDGFNSVENSSGVGKNYINGDKNFTISKYLCKSPPSYLDDEIVKIGDVEYSVDEYDDFIRIIWNNDDYLYFMTGNLSRDELLKIAENAE